MTTAISIIVNPRCDAAGRRTSAKSGPTSRNIMVRSFIGKHAAELENERLDEAERRS
jgi:hypothetical protein